MLNLFFSLQWFKLVSVWPSATVNLLNGSVYIHLGLEVQHLNATLHYFIVVIVTVGSLQRETKQEQQQHKVFNGRSQDSSWLICCLISCDWLTQAYYDSCGRCHSVYMYLTARSNQDFSWTSWPSSSIYICHLLTGRPI